MFTADQETPETPGDLKNHSPHQTALGCFSSLRTKNRAGETMFFFNVRAVVGHVGWGGASMFMSRRS